jgi:hypothetical protein
MGQRERFDVLRSLARSVANRAVTLVGRTAPVSAVRNAIDTIVHQRSRLDESRLTSAVAHTDDVASASAVARDGTLMVDISFNDNTHVAVVLTPGRVRFAPRGAKEIEFAVSPESLVTSPRVADVVGSIASEIAAVLWNMPRRGRSKARSGQVIVDRDGLTLRVDLRTTPAARALRNTPLEPLTEVFELRAITIRDSALHLDIALPSRP